MPQLDLTRGAVQLLAGALTQGSWYAEKDQTALVYRAGQILDIPEMDPGQEPPQTAPLPVLKAWQTAAVSVTLTDKQRDTAKACVQFFITKGNMPAGRPLSTLMRALGLTPEE